MWTLLSLHWQGRFEWILADRFLPVVVSPSTCAKRVVLLLVLLNRSSSSRCSSTNATEAIIVIVAHHAEKTIIHVLIGRRIVVVVAKRVAKERDAHVGRARAFDWRRHRRLRLGRREDSLVTHGCGWSRNHRGFAASTKKKKKNEEERRFASTSVLRVPIFEFESWRRCFLSRFFWDRWQQTQDKCTAQVVHTIPDTVRRYRTDVFGTKCACEVFYHLRFCLVKRHHHSCGK